MAKFFTHGTRRRMVTALSLALTASLSLGALAACAEQPETPADDDEETKVSATDTQLLRNGNFEFFGEMDEDRDDMRNFISTPTSWSFTSGSPSSDTRSGLVETGADAWKYLTQQGTAFTSVDDAVAHWKDDSVTLYDRLKFYTDFKSEIDALDSSSDAAKLFAEYSYTLDYEDVEDLSADLGTSFTLHAGVKEDEDGVLMIHNDRSSDGVLGTAQYYTSSTTITLEAGTAAEISAWVRTDKLTHYYAASGEEEKEELERRGGAYIGIINTVGGTTLDEMQIKNINTKGEWQKFTVYVRGNTYATTTFRIKLGLGQGTSSDNRYEAVNGYAFFDDITVTKMTASSYDTKVEGVSAKCDLNSKKDDKIFDRDTVTDTTFALDLLDAESYTSLSLEDPSIALTTESSGSNVYTSKVEDNRDEGASADEKRKQSIADVMTYAQIRTAATGNGYLQNIFKDDFSGKFPFGTEDTRDNVKVILLLSTNGAAYTATVKEDAFHVEPGKRLLVSFFVKTSSIRSGKIGAGVTLVDGENETSITPFDSTVVAPVNVDEKDEALSDIFKGWVQCFFFVSNDTDDAKDFTLKFTYGPTSVAGTKVSDYCEGYAAFADLKVMELSKSQYGYASTGSYAKKVELTATVSDTSKFNDAEASSDIEHGLATPTSYREARAGSNVFDSSSDIQNTRPEGVYAGLLNRDYAENYYGLDATAEGNGWKSVLDTAASGATDANGWWSKLFGDKSNPAYEARQPILLVNAGAEDAPSYGYVSSTLKTSLPVSTSRRISMRVKVSLGMTVSICLLDTSDLKEGFNTLLTPELPKATYWYDDEGNILACDPESDDFDEKTDVLFTLGTNGLYTKAGEENKYYANLANYDTDDNHNLVTPDGTIAFYYDEATNAYYAYYDEDATVKYTQVVEPLPTEVDGKSILRYAAPADSKPYASVITVEGSEANADRWVTVSFYVRSGSEAKNYRLEIWAGDRSNAQDGFKAGGYVFADGFKSESVSNFEGLRTEAADALLDTETNRLEGDDEKLNSSLALYYTYTLYDARDFLRHDRTLDEEDLGSHWGSYEQSSHTEGLVWLKHFDPDGETTGSPFCSLYIDYSVLDVSVTPDVLDDGSADDDTTDEEEEHTDSDVNIWLVLSSSLLAIVTIFAVVAVLVRFVYKRTKKSGRPKPAPKKKGSRITVVEEGTPQKPADDTPDPYDE